MMEVLVNKIFGSLCKTDTNIIGPSRKKNLEFCTFFQLEYGYMLGLFHALIALCKPCSSCRSYRMSIHKLLRLSQRRSFISSLFGFTFIATCLTVSASNILPCPVRPERGRFADSDEEGAPMMEGGQVKVVKRPRRWIEEKVPD